ncbi:polysaccharide biosynthesis C-terminal domain-containing protein [bacterium]|nr:polysaccharide biosynthesis C-terminal domain-containing protein [bacterium]
MADLGRKSINWNTLAVLIARSYEVLTGMVMMMFLTRYLGTSLYGDYVWITALVMLFQPLLNYEMDKVMVREIARDRSQLVISFQTVLFQKVVFTLLFVFFLLSMVFFSSLPFIIKKAFLVLGLGECFFQFWLAYLAFFRSIERMEYECIATVLFRTLQLSLILLVIRLDLGFISIFMSTMTADFFLFAVSTFFVHRRFCPVKPAFAWERLRFFLIESTPLFLSISFFIALLRLDVLLLGVLADPIQVSLFWVPHNIILQFGILPTALVTALLPVLSRIYKTDPDRYTRLVLQSEELGLLISVPILVFVFFSHQELVSVFAGQKFAEAGINLLILAPSFLFIFINFLHNAVLTATGNQRLIVPRTIWAFGLNLVLDLWLITQYQAMGAAIAKLVTYFLYFIMLVRLIRICLKRRGPNRYLSYFVLLGMTFTGCGLIQFWTGFVQAAEAGIITALITLAIKGVVVGVLYMLCFYMIRRRNVVSVIRTLFQETTVGVRSELLQPVLPENDSDKAESSS